MTLPSATILLDDEAGASGAGSQIVAVCSPVPGVLAVECAEFASTKAILDEHGYSQGAAYSALHFDETRLPIMFCAMPVAVAGIVSHFDRSLVTGTSIASVAAAANGSLEAVDAIVTVVDGGTVGTSTIVFDVSFDGGFSTQRIRLGTALSYTPPYLGMTLSLTVGTLVAGDVIRWRSTGPTYDAAAATAVRVALAAKNVAVRTLLFVGDAQSETIADAVRAAAETYASSNDRFIRARIQARDQYRAAALLGYRGRTVGAALTFLEVGAAGDTITRAAGSWVTDGFAVGDTIVVGGAVASAGINNVTGVIASLSSTVITLDTTDLIDEGPITSATITAYTTLTFAEVGATGDTVTRSSGSWVTDGFRAGSVSVLGTALNNVTMDVVTVSATVLTLGSVDLAAEVIGALGLTVSGVESNATWRASITSDFQNLTGAASRRLTIGAGYASKSCPITSWRFRRPASWGASLREYGHAEQTPTWRTADGPLAGFTLLDAAKDLAEHDERVDGGLLSSAFTVLRTWNNKNGCFVALDLTRADPGSLLSRSHNMDVANVLCTTVQSATQGLIGSVLELGAGGLASEASLIIIEAAVNAEIDVAMFSNIRGEGPRASPGTKWEASRADVLNVVGATLNGVATLRLNGTIEKIATRVAVPQGG